MNGKMDSVGKAKCITVTALFIIFGGVIGAATYVSFIPQTIRTPLKFGAAINQRGFFKLFAAPPHSRQISTCGSERLGTT